jgi:lysophospholipase L1-like esterase
MTTISRRDLLTALAGVILSGGRALKGSQFSDLPAFNMLVVGDSIIWGQGLEEKDKFYNLTAEWLRGDVFSGGREVDLKVKAHSGSNIKYHLDEAEKNRRAGRDEAHLYKPEVNVGFPSIWKQVEAAANEYKAEKKNASADLIMLTGGITDISVAKLLDPFKDKKRLPALIEKYCRDDMADLLEHALNHNPNSTIVVIGYYPILSPKTPSGRLLNNWLESMSFPDAIKPLANNPLTRPLLFKRLKNKGIARSRIWHAESNRSLEEAVNRINAKHGQVRAVFVRSPITEDTCLETPDTLLFRMHKNGVVEDSLYHARKADCREALPVLKKQTGINYPVRLCEIAAVGHPNPAGARAYSNAIQDRLTPHVAGMVAGT